MLNATPTMRARSFKPLHSKVPRALVVLNGEAGRPRPAAIHGDRLDAIGSTFAVKKGAAIFEEGEPAQHYYQVTQGTVRVYKLMEDGKRQIVTFALTGDFFGFGSGDEHDFSAEAITDCTIRRFSKAQAAALLCQDAALGNRLFAVVRDQLVAAQQRLVVVGRKTAKARVASFLDMLCARKSGTSAASVIDLAMGRSDIADYLGLALETVSRTLSQLRESRVIDLPTPQHVVVRNRAALHEIADGEFNAAEAA